MNMANRIFRNLFLCKYGKAQFGMGVGCKIRKIDNSSNFFSVKLMGAVLKFQLYV